MTSGRDFTTKSQCSRSNPDFLQTVICLQRRPERQGPARSPAFDNRGRRQAFQSNCTICVAGIWKAKTSQKRPDFLLRAFCLLCSIHSRAWSQQRAIHARHNQDLVWYHMLLRQGMLDIIIHFVHRPPRRSSGPASTRVCRGGMVGALGWRIST